MTDPKKIIVLIDTKVKSIEKLLAEVKVNIADLARLANEQAEEINYLEEEMESREGEDDS
jgi:hypothetical protein